MNENIIISNLKNYKKIKKSIIKWWFDNLTIISDFDNTLTKAIVNNKFVPSMISILRSENYLKEWYSEKAFELFNHYYPIEHDESLTIEQKTVQMEKWWEKASELLIEFWLNKLDILKVIASKKILFREYTKNFLKKLNKNNIPLIILSASWLWYEAILLYLNFHNVLFNNIYVYSNDFIWDEKWFAKQCKKPFFHSLNKCFSIIKDKNIIEKTKNRKNVILIWDSENDISMSDWYDYENILKIWFLNNDTEKKLELFKQKYDVVIINDSNMSFVLKLINEIPHP